MFGTNFWSACVIILGVIVIINMMWGRSKSNQEDNEKEYTEEDSIVIDGARYSTIRVKTYKVTNPKCTHIIEDTGNECGGLLIEVENDYNILDAALLDERGRAMNIRRHHYKCKDCGKEYYLSNRGDFTIMKTFNDGVDDD